MLEILNQHIFHSMDNQENWPSSGEFILKIPSKRGFEYYKKNAEIFKILDLDLLKNKKLFQSIRNSLQPYVLSDSLVKFLKKKSVAVAINQPVPYMSPENYWDEEKIVLTRNKVWSVHELEEFFINNKIRLCAICVSPESVDYLHSIYSLAGADLSIWEQLAVFDLLECHREPFFFLKLSQGS